MLDIRLQVVKIVKSIHYILLCLAKKLQETSDSDTKTTPVKRAPPQKRGRKSETSNANGSDSGTPTKRRLVEKSKVETKEDPKGIVEF